jgi:hypothetical protein
MYDTLTIETVPQDKTNWDASASGLPQPLQAHTATISLPQHMLIRMRFF